ncbi:MazG family protein [Actinocatenispora rupis]|uniref:Nucleoside triphosphate pyrophosphohydrolase n=1 Tax=Actinocatenispora rupis TaxID=519421 RepID=A0A8J3J590_9ACTN|nr:MazG family protein [Actinocatenispora rupis]GID10362.1 nucleoside triphosphate pyrophosphohydrolase [Actinocatenispora rupis]
MSGPDPSTEPTGVDVAGRRIVLLHTSPRLPAGLLTARAWDLVRAHPVYAAADTPQTGALRAAGATVTVVPGGPAEQVDALLSAGTDVVWLAGPDGDLSLARMLSGRLVGMAEPPVIEAEYGSWDPPGARLLDVVATMDTLRRTCPWDREQTHTTLAPYLLEETYEAYDAIESGDRALLREELGDVLFQVAFHARVAADADAGAFDLDDVAGDLVAKLVRRHPHVFADVTVADAGEVEANWDEIKRAEKSRDSAVDGVPLAQPALQLAAKLLSRVERAGLSVPPTVATAPDPDSELGATLFELVTEARTRGLDAEAALRRAALRYAGAVRAVESGSAEPPDTP